MVIRNVLAVFCFIILSVSSLFAQGGYQGTDFWVAFPQNARAENASGLRFTVYITSPKATSGTITETRTGKTTDFMLEPNKPYMYEADSVNQLMENGISNSTFHVTSKNNVTILCYSSRRASTDSYVAIPTSLVRNTYAAIGYDALRGESVFTTQFDIIATENNTNVAITYPRGKEETGAPHKVITLNKGEVYHQNSNDFKEYNYDLTGTIVESSSPVAFLTGNTCAQVPKDKNFCDVLLEMLPPAELNGKEFIIPAFALRDRSSIRVVALSSNTKVTLNGNDVATLRSGEYYQNDSIQGTALLKTSENAYVTQYGQSSTASSEQIADPDMIVLSPMGSFARHIDFVVPDKIAVVGGGWQHWVTLVSKTVASKNITLDGKTVDPSRFKQIPNTVYSIAHVEVASGSHQVTSTTDVAVYSYGYGKGGDNYDSYGHNCGMNLLNKGQ